MLLSILTIGISISKSGWLFGTSMMTAAIFTLLCGRYLNIGGGAKRAYRIIDFKRNKLEVPGKVEYIEYDPNRTANIALLNYVDGEKRYIVAPTGLKVGNEVVSGKGSPIEVGNTLPLSDIQMGPIIHINEIRPGQGALLARSAGAFAQLMSREGNYATIKLTSVEISQILFTCMATIGSVSNAEAQLARKGKAGRNRWMGRRPRTRPVVMNPVDHPMGGGEGKASGGHPRSKNGIPAKVYKTRAKKKASNKYIIERRKKK